MSLIANAMTSQVSVPFSILSSLEHDVRSICHYKDVEEDTCHVGEPQEKCPMAAAVQRVEGST